MVVSTALTNPVVVNPLPAVDFTFSDVCEDDPIAFTDNSGASVTSWSWDFGDNSNSNQQSPTHLFSQPGAYNITLTVTDGTTGCTNEVVKTGFVHPKPEVDFSWENQCFNTITLFKEEATLTDPYGTTLSYWEWDFGDGNTSTDRNPVHNYPPGSYDVTLTVATSKGCTETFTQTVEIIDTDPIVPNDADVCTGYSAYLWVDNVPNDMEVIWLYDPNSTTPFHVGESLNTIPLTDNVTYWVALRDKDGCVSNPLPIRGRTFHTPHIDFTASATELSIPNAIVEFTAILQNNPSSMLWDFGDGTTSTQGNPVHQYDAPGVYTVTLTVIDENGCERVLTKKEYIIVDESVNMWIPNAFTPNGDGNNDEFLIHTQLIVDFEINIYNRWGQLIYTSQNMNFRWDGTDMKNGTPIPEGVVTYLIKATAYNGAPVQRAGTITIIR